MSLTLQGRIRGVCISKNPLSVGLSWLPASGDSLYEKASTFKSVKLDTFGLCFSSSITRCVTLGQVSIPETISYFERQELI